MPQVQPSNGLTEDQAALLEHYKYSTPVYPTVMADLFDRTNQSGLGTSTSRHTWVTGIGGLNVIGGRAGIATDVGSRSTVDAGIADYQITVDLYTQKVAGHQAWLVFRYVDASNYLRIGVNGGQFVLQRVTGGAATVLVTSSIYTSTDGKYSVTLTAVGDQITATLPEAQFPFGVQSEAQGQASKIIGLQLDKTDMFADNLIVQTV